MTVEEYIKNYVKSHGMSDSEFDIVIKKINKATWSSSSKLHIVKLNYSLQNSIEDRSAKFLLRAVKVFKEVAICY